MNWEAWLKEHIASCKQCDMAFNHLDEAQGGMCEVAFSKFQEYLRKSSKPPKWWEFWKWFNWRG